MHDLMNDILTRCGIAFIISFPVAFMLKRMYDIFIVPFIRKKKLQDAINKNRVVEATLVDYHDDKFSDTEHHAVRIHGFYEYSVGNRKYKYSRWYNNSPKYNIELYYQKNPQKAVEADIFGRLEGFGSLFILYIISLIVSVILATFIKLK